MKKNSILVKTVLMSMLTAGSVFSFTSCSDEVEMDQAVQAPLTETVVDSSLETLQNIGQEGHTVPFEVKCDGDWRIEFEYNEDRQICYAMPDHGRGNATIQLSVIDNWTNERRTGKLIVRNLTDGTSQEVAISQKCNLDNEAMTRGGEDAKNASNLGNRIYGIGYGYNAMKNMKDAVSLHPILMVDSARKNDMFRETAARVDYNAKSYTGSCLSELASNIKAEAKLGGKYAGFKGELGAAFGTQSFDKNEHEYALTTVDVYKEEVYLEGMTLNSVFEYIVPQAFADINGVTLSEALGKEPWRRGMIRERASYPDETYFKRLINDYGTHLILKAELGGHLTYATTIDISKVVDKYDISAYAKGSYENSFVNASASVSGKKESTNSFNSEAIKVKVTGFGGTKPTLDAVQDSPSKKTVGEWRSSLKDIKNCTVVGVDMLYMIPLYELVDDYTEKGRARKEALRQYMECGQMEKDFRENVQEKIYTTGTIAHLTELPDFTPNYKTNKYGTKVADVFVGGQKVARVCEEYIPEINSKARVKVIYPIANNTTKYNMGYYVGDSTHKPAKVCWKGTGRPELTEISTEECAEQKEFYIRGSNIYSKAAAADILSGNKIAETTTEFQFMSGKYFQNAKDARNYVHTYPIVKIANNLWTTEDINESVKDAKDRTSNEAYGKKGPDLTLYYYYNYKQAESHNFTENWKVASMTDYQDVKDYLTKNDIEVPGRYMLKNGLTGFNVDFKGWYDSGRSGSKWVTNNSQMEYMTSDRGHVTIGEAGNFEIKNQYNDNFYMKVRMVQHVR